MMQRNFIKYCSLVLMLFTLSISISLADDIKRDCDPEPTDMDIAYGEFMTGDNCHNIWWWRS